MTSRYKPVRGQGHFLLAAAESILPASLILVMVFVPEAKTNIAVLGMTAGALFFATQLRRFVDWTGILISTIILTSSFSAQYWLEHRVAIASFPVSVPDAVAALFGLCGLVSWLRSPRVRLDAIGRLVLLWLLYNSIVAVTVGLSAGNSVYAVAQEYRLVVYAATGYFATLMLFETRGHLAVVFVSSVAAGVVVSVWQLVITALGREMATTEMVYIIPGGISRALRDVGLPLYVAGSALVTLVVTQMEVPGLWRRARGVIWLAVPVFCIAILLSMTRTVWVSLVASAVLSLLYVIVAGRHTARNILQALLFIVILGSTLVLARTMIREVVPTVYEAIEMTWSYSFSASDTTYFNRVDSTKPLLDYLGTEANALLIGMGFGNMWSGTTREGPFVDVHNAYFAYLVIGGLVGLALFLAVWCAPAVIYWWLLRRDLDRMTRAYVVASSINWLVMSLLLTSMPPHWTESVLLGVMLGIATLLRYRQVGKPMWLPAEREEDALRIHRAP